LNSLLFPVTLHSPVNYHALSAAFILLLLQRPNQ